MKLKYLLLLGVILCNAFPLLSQADVKAKAHPYKNKEIDLSLALSHGIWSNALTNVFGLGLKTVIGIRYQTTDKIALMPYIGGQVFGKSVGDLDGIREVLLRVNGGVQLDYHAFGKESNFNPLISVQYSWVSSYFVNELYNFNNQETSFRLSDPSMVAHTVSILPGIKYQSKSNFYLVFELDLLFPNMKITDRLARDIQESGFVLPKHNIMDLSHANLRFGWIL